jgi:hypothetical protein
MSRVPSEEKRVRNPGEGPRPGTAREQLDSAWRKLSDWDKRAALRDLAASLKASRRGREGDG